MKNLLEYTSSPVKNEKLWKAISNHDQFDTKGEPYKAKIVAWIALQATTNFNAAKLEVQKYLDGTTTLPKLIQGLEKVIKEKYEVQLILANIKQLEHTDLMYTPNKELLEPYTAVKTALQINAPGQVRELLQVLFPDSETGPDIILCTNLPLVQNPFTVQTRFNEFITDYNFRLYFKPADKNTPTNVIITETKDILKEALQYKLLEATVNNKTYITLQTNYRMKG